jgi:hypothetical protein
VVRRPKVVSGSSVDGVKRPAANGNKKKHGSPVRALAFRWALLG